MNVNGDVLMRFHMHPNLKEVLFMSGKTEFLGRQKIILKYKEVVTRCSSVPSLALFFFSQALLLTDAVKVPRMQSSVSLFS